MKKIKTNRLGMFLGIGLCVALVAFSAVKAANAQTTGIPTKARGLDRPATINDIYERIAVLEERLDRIEKKIDANDEVMVPARRHIEVILDGVRTLLKEKR